jgi:hypothetical protein
LEIWGHELIGYAPVGDFAVTVAATDGDQVSEHSEFWIICTDGNHPPERILVPSNTFAELGKSFEMDMSQYFYDQDGDRLEYIFSALPPGIEPFNEKLHGFPEEIGSWHVRCAANDTRAVSETAEFWLYIVDELPAHGGTPAVPGFVGGEPELPFDPAVPGTDNYPNWWEADAPAPAALS